MQQQREPASNRPALASGLTLGRWIVMATLIVALAVVASWTWLATLDRASHAAGTVVSSLGEAVGGIFKGAVRYDQRQVVMTAVGQCRAVRRLVVATVPVDVTVSTESVKTLWGMYLGTSRVDLRARGNRVQFYVPLQDVAEGDVSLDRRRGVLTVRIPRPVVDSEMVFVQSDPALVDVRTQVGWASLDMTMGAELRRQARTALKAAVIEQALRDRRLAREVEQVAADAVKKELETVWARSGLPGSALPVPALEVVVRAD